MTNDKPRSDTSDKPSDEEILRMEGRIEGARHQGPPCRHTPDHGALLEDCPSRSKAVRAGSKSIPRLKAEALEVD
jgi:hypothetical protein